MRVRIIRILFGLLFSVCLTENSSAGFFEMPEVTEIPQLERKSLLLDLDIPSVRDRESNPQSGPRLNIKKFKLQGLVEYPELGITKADIEKLIEGVRFDLMDEFSVLESGFTANELEQVSDLLGDIEEETIDRHITDLEVQRLVWLIREQRSKRGVTLGQIETVADRITKFYRERGFILAKAYIPKQQVRDGIVTLTLLLGTLGEVEVHDNELYDSAYLASSFENMLTKPVSSSVVEESLYLINDYPGMIVTGYFEPGSQVGDTKLNLNVKSEHVYKTNVRMDNHGSEQTGQYRFYGETFWNNPFGNADQLLIAALITVDPNNSEYGQLRYSTRVLSPRFNLTAGISSNDFVLGPGNSEPINALELFGETIQTDITATYRIKRSRTHSYYADFVYQQIESQLRIGSSSNSGDSGLDDIVENFSAIFTYDLLNGESKILHQGDVKFTSGRFDKGAELGQDDKYSIVNLNYSLLTFWQLPYFESQTRIIYRTAIQYASSPLSSINQFSLAGPTRARGYEVNQFSADHAVYMGVDWIFNAPEFLDIAIGGSSWKNIVHPFIFMDASWGKALSLIENTDHSTGQLIDAGFGLQFSYLNNLQGNLQLAFPIDENFSSSDINVGDDSVKMVFYFQYSF